MVSYQWSLGSLNPAIHTQHSTDHSQKVVVSIHHSIRKTVVLVTVYLLTIQRMVSMYHQLSMTRRTKTKSYIFLVLFCSCLCPIDWRQVLSREWRCSWSSAWGLRKWVHYWKVTFLNAFCLNYIFLSWVKFDTSFLLWVRLPKKYISDQVMVWCYQTSRH